MSPQPPAYWAGCSASWALEATDYFLGLTRFDVFVCVDAPITCSKRLKSLTSTPWIIARHAHNRVHASLCMFFWFQNFWRKTNAKPWRSDSDLKATGASSIWTQLLSSSGYWYLYIIWLNRTPVQKIQTRPTWTWQGLSWNCARKRRAATELDSKSIGPSVSAFVYRKNDCICTDACGAQVKSMCSHSVLASFGYNDNSLCMCFAQRPFHLLKCDCRSRSWASHTCSPLIAIMKRVIMFT